MEQDGSSGFDVVWETLVRTGIAKNLHDEVTVTPSAYRGGDLLPEDLTLPPPLVMPDPELTLENLPRIRVAEAPALEADLQLGEVLGRGGMGSVWEARQTALKRDVAIKRLARPDEPTHVDALLREAVITGSLEHPNIVPVHALGRDERNHPVLVMKRIQGARWSELLETDPLERHLEILVDVCNALHYAHAQGVVHLDLKPQNVIVGAFGEVALLDFGIARRIGEPPSELMLGTPAYMAPEMVQTASPDARTDVYLLGAMLHRILTGKARHVGKTTHAVLMSAYKSEPVDYPPEVPVELAELCNRATHRDPDQRPQTALAFREALQAWERHRSSTDLTRVAIARVERMKAMIGEPDANPRAVRELAGSARFGLREALNQWPENSAATSALMELLEHLVRWEIAHGVPDEAAHHLAKLGELGPAGRARHDALSAEVEDAARKARALARLGREMDLSVASGWRVAFVLVIGLVGTVAGALLILGTWLDLVVLDHPLNFGLALSGAVAFTTVLVVARKRLMTNVANRRVWFMVLFSAWAFVGNRALGWAVDLTIPQTIAQELLLAAAAGGLLAVAIDLRLLVGAALLVLATVAAVLFPAFSLEIAITSIASCGAIGAAALWHWIR